MKKIDIIAICLLVSGCGDEPADLIPNEMTSPTQAPIEMNVDGQRGSDCSKIPFLGKWIDLDDIVLSYEFKTDCTLEKNITNLANPQDFDPHWVYDLKISGDHKILELSHPGDKYPSDFCLFSFPISQDPRVLNRRTLQLQCLWDTRIFGVAD